MPLALSDTRHDWRECDDEFCDAFPCKVYREGHERGYGAGHAAGFDAGYAAASADGYAAGYSDGSAE